MKTILDDVFNYDERLQHAVRFFWEARQKSTSETLETIKPARRDKNLDAFRDMIADVVRKYVPTGSEVQFSDHMNLLPGSLRETNRWDMVIHFRDRLLAAIELKSLCGPSFSTNADQCCEEVIASGYEFRAAQGAALFGPGASPFLGSFSLVEDAEASREPVNTKSPHFPTDQIFHSSSYQQRMQILCERMVQQQLYSCASVLVAPNELTSGQSSQLSNQTSFRSLLTRLAWHLTCEVDLVLESGSRATVLPDGFERTSLLAGDLFSSFEDAEEGLALSSDETEMSK